jgi:hypothetical protein
MFDFLDIIKELLVLAGYLSGKTFPKPLTKEEESDCLIRSAHGDEAARHKLVEHNLRLVAHIVKKYQNTALSGDDLISIGTIGLIKAVNSFLPKKGTALATYAAKCIENAIRSQRFWPAGRTETALLFSGIGPCPSNQRSTVRYGQAKQGGLLICPAVCPQLSLFCPS